MYSLLIFITIAFPIYTTSLNIFTNTNTYNKTVMMTCEEEIECMQEKSNSSDYIEKHCSKEYNNCDVQCQMSFFNLTLCVSSNCPCENKNSTFNWNCIDNCLESINNKNFTNLIHCTFRPCRPKSNGIWIALAIIVSIILGLGIYTLIIWSKNKQSIRLRFSAASMYERISSSQ